MRVRACPYTNASSTLYLYGTNCFEVSLSLACLLNGLATMVCRAVRVRGTEGVLYLERLYNGTFGLTCFLPPFDQREGYKPTIQHYATLHNITLHHTSIQYTTIHYNTVLDTSHKPVDRKLLNHFLSLISVVV